MPVNDLISRESDRDVAINMSKREFIAAMMMGAHRVGTTVMVSINPTTSKDLAECALADTDALLAALEKKGKP